MNVGKGGTRSWQSASCFFALFCLWPYLSFAQPTLDFQNFTQQDGLSSNYVLKIFQDHEGFIWIGTESGLDRFDGQHFLHFKHDPEDPETLDDNWVQSIYEDSQHNLWIGTEKGLNHLNRATGKIERVPMYRDGRKMQNVPENLCEDQSGKLWMNIIGEGLFQLKSSGEEGKNWSVEYFAVEDSLADNSDPWNGNRLLFATTEELWFSSKYAIKRFQITTGKLRYFFPPSIDPANEGKVNIINSTHLGDGTIAFYAQNSIFTLDTQADTPQIEPLKSIEFKAVEDRPNYVHINFLRESKDALFASIYRDLFFYNAQTDQLESIQPQAQTSNRSFPDFIRAPFKDRQGNLWIGTEGSGLYLGRKLESPFTFYQNDPADPNSLSPGQVRTFTEDENGQLWVGILNHGIDQFIYKENGGLEKKKSIIQLIDQANAPSIDRLVKIIQGPQQNLWIASLNQGVIKVDPSGRQSTVFGYRPNDSTAVSANRIWGLTQSRDGYIWAGTWQDGLNRIDPTRESITTIRHEPDQPNTLISDGIRYLLSDPQGMLWIGTDSGLSRFDPEENQFTNYQHDPNDPNSLSDNLVWAIHIDSQGDLWVGTNTGLNRYDPATQGFERFYERDGLPNNTIYGLLEDDDGVLWVSTENGLARKLPGEADLTFFPLGQTYGLETLSFLPKAVLNSAYGEQLFFGSTDGILAVSPSLFKQGKPQPQLAIHSISRFNPQVEDERALVDYFANASPEVLKLSHRDQSVTITLSDMNWIGATGLRYEYRLTGLNRQWVPVGNDMKVSFTNLFPGKYQLEVKAINAENVSSEAVNLLRLRVYPPWWKSLWAYILYGLFAGASLFLLYRFQLRRQLEKQEAENAKALDAFKSRLYTNITHEFRTPLTIISGMVDQIEKKPEQWLKKGAKMIRKNNANLLDLINQMLELQKVESGKLEARLHLGDIIPFLRTLADQFQAFAQSKEQQLAFTSELDALQMDFDGDKTLRIVSNLLSNAIKYTPEKGKIFFTISSTTRGDIEPNHCLHLTVTDTGPGIPKDQLPYIFNRYYQANVNTSGTGTGIGLSLTQELVKLLKGKIEVRSEEGQGTTFQVFLPITQEAVPGAAQDKLSIQSAVLGMKSPIEKQKPTAAELPLALIVEDNYDIAQYLQICLEGSYELEMASNGQEGIDKALEQIPDIIISDVMMPLKDGFELCETLKGDLRTSHIPIILLTAKSDVTSRIAGLKQGADDYLAKPFNEEELLVRMQNLLEVRRKLQDRYQNVFDRPLPKVKVATPNVEDAFILKIKEIFEDRMMESDFNLDTLSQELNLSRSNLYRKIKALTGRSPAIFLRLLRLQKARQLLQSSDLSVKQVAYDVGFSDPSYFSRSYTEEFGESPSNTSA